MENNNEASGGGLLGGILAAFLSWHSWHSIGWLIIHFICSWFYVIYWLIFIWDKKW